MANVQLNCQGLNCPIPIVRISQAMRKIDSHQTLEVTANDPAFGADVKAWVKKMGHKLLELEEGDVHRAIIQKL